MNLVTAYWLFPICLAAIAAGSVWMSRGLHRLGTGLGLLPGLLGLITALGSDSPEISSAITALLGGNHEVGVGVVLGSNLFNLAALMGVSAILAGRVAMQRRVLLFNASVSLLETGLVALMILGVLGPAAGMAALVAIFLLYALALSVRSETVEQSALPGRLRAALSGFLRDVHAHHDKHGQAGQGGRPGWRDAAGLAAALVLIVLGSMGIVHAVLAIGKAWGIAHGLLGALVLAALTGFPNAYTSIRLALRGQGTAVVSEAINSNTINMVVGIGLPALIFGMSRQPVAVMEMWWLLGLTALASGLTWLGRGLSRRDGGMIVAAYLVFVAMRVILY